MNNFVSTEFLLGNSLAVGYIKLSAESQDGLMHLIVNGLQILWKNFKMCLVKNSNFGCELLLFSYYASEGNIKLY
jgi:hypothetical protein